ncbi:hypothetical protein O1157_00765 [Streptomyces albogriseolus]
MPRSACSSHRASPPPPGSRSGRPSASRHGRCGVTSLPRRAAYSHCSRPESTRSPTRCGAGRPAGPLTEALEQLRTAHAAQPEQGPDIGALIRLTRTEPGLRAVWLQTHDAAEPAFARALAERAGLPADDLRPTVQAALLNAALRAAVEHHAWHTADPATARADLETALRTALAVAAAGLV